VLTWATRNARTRGGRNPGLTCRLLKKRLVSGHSDGSGETACKTVGSAYVGSNPTPATSRNTRSGILCVLWQRRFRERCATSSASVARSGLRWSARCLGGRLTGTAVCPVNTRRSSRRGHPGRPGSASSRRLVGSCQVRAAGTGTCGAASTAAPAQTAVKGAGFDQLRMALLHASADLPGGSPGFAYARPSSPWRGSGVWGGGVARSPRTLNHAW
jgi:hypothetical protein